MPVVSNTRKSERSSKIAAATARAITKTSKAKPRPSTKQAPEKARARSSGGAAKAWKDGDVRFTHPDRVYWVDVGVTKQDLADYYRSVWDVMAAHVVERPLALVRCPD